MRNTSAPNILRVDVLKLLLNIVDFMLKLLLNIVDLLNIVEEVWSRDDLNMLSTIDKDPRGGVLLM